MKYSLTLHYSVRNGGDGSAYPTFMSSAALADWDQDHMSEGWGESCTGSITLESDSPIVVKSDVTTPESFFVDLLDNDNEEELAEFVQEFFPNGKPKFTVQTRPVSKMKDYMYNDVYVDGVKVAEDFRRTDESGEVFEKLLNS